jgi:hypothetical protein
LDEALCGRQMPVVQTGILRSHATWLLGRTVACACLGRKRLLGYVCI